MYTYDTCPCCDEFVKIEYPREVAVSVICQACDSGFYVDYGPADELAEAFWRAG